MDKNVKRAIELKFPVHGPVNREKSTALWEGKKSATCRLGVWLRGASTEGP